MSDSSDQQELIAQLSTFRINNYAAVASTALYIADFIHTFPMEVHIYWSSPRKLTSLAVLFFVGRYSMLLYLPFGIWAQFPNVGSNTACAASTYITILTNELSIICTSALLVLRTYAICDRSRLVLFVGFSIVLVRAALVIYANLGSSTFSTVDLPSSPDLCIGFVADQNFPLVTKFELVIPGLALALDTVLSVLLVWKTLRQAIQARKHGQHSITQLILRDGIIYYIIVTGTAIFNVVPSPNAGAAYNLDAIVQPFFNVLPTMLINRLVLNLRTYSDPEFSAETLPENARNPTTVVFARSRFLGNIGAPLESGSFGWAEEDSDEQDFVDAETKSCEDVSKTAGGATTLVPVVYENGNLGEIEMIPVERAV